MPNVNGGRYGEGGYPSFGYGPTSNPASTSSPFEPTRRVTRYDRNKKLLVIDLVVTDDGQGGPEVSEALSVRVEGGQGRRRRYFSDGDVIELQLPGISRRLGIVCRWGSDSLDVDEEGVLGLVSELDPDQDGEPTFGVALRALHHAQGGMNLYARTSTSGGTRPDPRGDNDQTEVAPIHEALCMTTNWGNPDMALDSITAHPHRPRGRGGRGDFRFMLVDKLEGSGLRGLGACACNEEDVSRGRHREDTTDTSTGMEHDNLDGDETDAETDTDTSEVDEDEERKKRKRDPQPGDGGTTDSATDAESLDAKAPKSDYMRMYISAYRHHRVTNGTKIMAWVPRPETCQRRHTGNDVSGGQDEFTGFILIELAQESEGGFSLWELTGFPSLYRQGKIRNDLMSRAEAAWYDRWLVVGGLAFSDAFGWTSYAEGVWGVSSLTARRLNQEEVSAREVDGYYTLGSYALMIVPYAGQAAKGAWTARTANTTFVIPSRAGDHIVLGLKGPALNATAAQVGGRTLMQDPNWRNTFLAALRNPNARFTVGLDGLSGTTTYSQVMGAAQRGATPGASNLNWELAQIYQAGRLSDVTFVRAGQIVANPFR
jgi:hypothetical protein